MRFPETFKALADPIRQESLVMLKGGKLSAGEITGHFSIFHDKRHHLLSSCTAEKGRPHTGTSSQSLRACHLHRLPAANHSRLPGLLLWDQLPDQLIIHWDAMGESNGYVPKAIGVFGLLLLIFCF